MKNKQVTNETKLRLERELVETEKQFRKASESQGDACGTDCDWHDNAAYDFATKQTELYATRLSHIRQLLNGLTIIVPRTKTDKVGMGNGVLLKIDGKEYQFTLLSEEDSITRKEWLSCNSPIGQAILGKPVGVYGNIEIVKISKGNFK
jgi:transcription elongation GreA/GreB family factor